MKKIKNKATPLGIFGTASSSLGIVGLHNVCHVACEGLIAFLAILGITLVGMPLAFLQDYSLFLSAMGLVSAIFGLYFYYIMRNCNRRKFWLAFNFIVLIFSIIGIAGNFI